jgi:acetyl esterase/lipase
VTLLPWVATPPGARKGDEKRAKMIASAIKGGTYQVPGGKRYPSVPTVDVYLPRKEKATGVGVLVFPGGAYHFVSTHSEGLITAMWLNANGIAAFVCNYRCRSYRHPVPFWDAQRAIRTVRSRAAEFGVKPNRIGVWGCSAGGHLAATLSVHYKESFGRKPIDDIDKVSARPDFTCLVYPVVSMRDDVTHGGSRSNLLGAKPSEELIAKLSADEQVAADTPPAFLAHAKRDGVKCANSRRYHEALKAKGVATRYLLLKTGGHGGDVRDSKPIIRGSKEHFADDFLNWLKSIGI